MPSIVFLNQGTYVPGTYNLGPASIPAGLSGVTLSLDGTNMTNPALQVSISLDLSLDGGLTWASTNPSSATNPFPVAMTLAGGAKDKSGNPLAAYTLTCPIPGSGMTGRQIRATIIVSGQSLVTQGTLTTV